VESNNTLATAQAINANPALVNGSLATGDVDYYAITLAAGKTLSATLTPPTTADFDLYIHNSAGTQLASSVQGTGVVDAVSYTNSGSASITIYVRVLRYSGTGSYTLRLSQ
jgi:serine protease